MTTILSIASTLWTAACVVGVLGAGLLAASLIAAAITFVDDAQAAAEGRL